MNRRDGDYVAALEEHGIRMIAVVEVADGFVVTMFMPRELGEGSAREVLRLAARADAEAGELGP